jgi:hypothetical protein
MGVDTTKKTSRDLIIENNKLLKELSKRPLVVLKDVQEAIHSSRVAFEDFQKYQDEIEILRQELQRLRKMLDREMKLKENQVISYAKWLLVLINTGLLIWLLRAITQ